MLVKKEIRGWSKWLETSNSCSTSILTVCVWGGWGGWGLIAELFNSCSLWLKCFTCKYVAEEKQDSDSIENLLLQDGLNPLETIRFVNLLIGSHQLLPRLFSASDWTCRQARSCRRSIIDDKPPTVPEVHRVPKPKQSVLKNNYVSRSVNATFNIWWSLNTRKFGES